MAQENQMLFKRIQERGSFYNVAKWEKDYEKSQYYKRSHCIYPSINFGKTTSTLYRPKRNLVALSETSYIRKPMTSYNRFQYTTKKNEEKKDKIEENINENNENENNEEDDKPKVLYETSTYIENLGNTNVQFTVQYNKYIIN